MKVLFVHDRCGEQGGAEANVRLSAEGLVRRGDAVALLHGDETTAGIERFRAAFPTRFAWSAGREAAVAQALAWDPDVVYAHKVADPAVLAAIHAAGAHVVRMVHDHDLYCQRSYRYFPFSRKICTRRAGYACALTCGVLRSRDGVLPVRLAWPGRILRGLEQARTAQRMVVASSFMRDELTLHGFAAERISVLPIGVRAAPPDEISAYDQPLILYVGQLLRGKGVDALLDACARLPAASPWRLGIVGDGSHRAKLKAQVDRLGLRARVTFHGWMTQEAIAPLYRQARVAAVPSLWPEPMGMVGPEAMQRALPVVAFAAGGVREWLDPGVTGELVAWNDRDAYANALARLVGDRALAERMGRAGLERARALFTVDAYLDRLRDLLSRESQV
ncbi:MAG: glycosyltransferase family 4 protein [Planctomycetes bacterium]|nr:glycosyltransferase family 4 protein [Planctomycetota bacterium]